MLLRLFRGFLLSICPTFLFLLYICFYYDVLLFLHVGCDTAFVILFSLYPCHWVGRDMQTTILLATSKKQTMT